MALARAHEIAVLVFELFRTCTRSPSNSAIQKVQSEHSSHDAVINFDCRIAIARQTLFPKRTRPRRPARMCVFGASNPPQRSSMASVCFEAISRMGITITVKRSLRGLWLPLPLILHRHVLFDPGPPRQLHSSGPAYYAKCNVATDHPIECGSNWYDPFDGLSAAGFSQYAPCPSSDCDIVRTTLPDVNCRGPFIESGYYFYFSAAHFEWFCASSWNTYFSYVQYRPTTTSAWSSSKWTELILKPNTYTVSFERSNGEFCVT